MFLQLDIVHGIFERREDPKCGVDVKAPDMIPESLEGELSATQPVHREAMESPLGLQV